MCGRLQVPPEPGSPTVHRPAHAHSFAAPSAVPHHRRRLAAPRVGVLVRGGARDVHRVRPGGRTPVGRGPHGLNRRGRRRRGPGGFPGTPGRPRDEPRHQQRHRHDHPPRQSRRGHERDDSHQCEKCRHVSDPPSTVNSPAPDVTRAALHHYGHMTQQYARPSYNPVRFICTYGSSVHMTDATHRRYSGTWRQFLSPVGARAGHCEPDRRDPRGAEPVAGAADDRHSVQACHALRPARVAA